MPAVSVSFVCFCFLWELKQQPDVSMGMGTPPTSHWDFSFHLTPKIKYYSACVDPFVMVIKGSLV